MSLITDIMGGSLAKPIEAAGNLASKFITTEKDKIDYLSKMDNMQVKINEIEAANNNTLNSWRSFLGWVLDICVVLYFVPLFIFSDYFWVKQMISEQRFVQFPVDPSSMLALLSLLLGFGVYNFIKK